MDHAEARILIIDDDAALGRTLSKRLERQGYKNLAFCTDVETAVQALARQIPDIILTDIHMRHISGLDFVQRLRAHPNPKLRAIPVIFVTGDASRETLLAASKLGSSGLVLKPFRLEALQAKIEQVLKQAARAPGGD